LFDDPYIQNLLSPKLSPKMDEKWLKQLEMNLENEDGGGAIYVKNYGRVLVIV
jgi:hypothetical protein